MIRPQATRLLNTVRNGQRFPHLTGKRLLTCALQTLPASRKASK